MKELRELLSPRNTWADYALFGESIPHLLHWDLAYLWILQRELGTRPAGWQPKVEAWRRLLCMLLLNELQLDTKAIPQPLSTYTQARGVNKVTFVRAPSTSFGEKVIGVISPLVLIRPLPEPNRFGLTAEELADVLPAHYLSDHKGIDRRQQLLQTVEHAKQSLRRSGSSLASSLETIIDTELALSVQRSNSVFPVFEHPTPIPLLNSADASAWESPNFLDLRLMVAQGTTGQRLAYVPKCSECGESVTFSEATAPINVTQDISIACPICASVSLFALEDFGIFREGQCVYVWREIQQFAELGDVVIPPSPEVIDDEVRFSWNPGMLGGESTRTRLRLRFSQAIVRAISPREIKFDRLIIPGAFERFRGHPIRPEWLFAVEKLPTCDVQTDVVNFREMRVRGLRFPVAIPTYPKAACRIVSDLQVGIYPKPQYANWSRYRIFWNTESAINGYTVRAVRNNSTRTVSASSENGIVEWREQLPYAVTIEESLPGQRSSNGATWGLPSPAPETTGAQPIYMGIDFGTTTSIVYVDMPDGSPEAITVEDILGAAFLLSGDGPLRSGFLPADNSNMDPTFFPSALWYSGEGYTPIRWTSVAPSRSHYAVHGFKWGRNHEELQQQYLQELLFLCLPAALRKAFPHGVVAPIWKIGFAFPLAFSDPQRAQYLRTFESLRTQLQAYAGGTPTISSINESFACVKAFGEHQFGEVFLIADLGGGSLDVALFELVRGDRGKSALQEYQVGSAKIGGESFVEALARGIGVDQQSRDSEYWKLRDAILTQSTTQNYGGSESQFAEIANRLLPAAQELLRVMAAAFASSEPTKKVQFVLVGNGWRIAEYQTGTQRSSRVAREELEGTFSLFEVSTLVPYRGRLEVSPKHLVAIGALQNAKPGGRHELDEAAHQSRMPAGRNINVNLSSISIPWNQLVGSAIQTLSPGVKVADLEFDRNSGPEPPKQWSMKLNYAIPDLQDNPADAVIRSRMNVVGSGLDKGPLQVILEKRVEELRELR